jgi:hypothetical protein
MKVNKTKIKNSQFKEEKTKNYLRKKFNKITIKIKKINQTLAFNKNKTKTKIKIKTMNKENFNKNNKIICNKNILKFKNNLTKKKYF